MWRNVLLISHGFQPSYEKAFSNALANRGVVVTLAGSVRTEFQDLSPSVRAYNLLKSMDPSRSIIEKISAKFIYIFRLTRLVTRNRAFVVHLIGNYITSSAFLGVFELLLYRGLSNRVLVTVHNLLPHDRHSRMNYYSAWLAYRIPHKLIVHTEKMRTGLIEQWSIDPNKIIIMEHGIDVIPLTRTNRMIGGSPELNLLIFGGVAKYKGVDTALLALTLLDDFSIVLNIVGACRDPQYEAELRDLISHVPTNHRVKWRNEYIPESEVQDIFELADAVLLPYRHIDQSGVLFTAYRFGVPVIAFDVGSFSQYVEPHIGMVVLGNDSYGLAASIIKFRDCAHKFNRDEIKAYAGRYSWDNTVAPVLDLYT